MPWQKKEITVLTWIFLPPQNRIIRCAVFSATRDWSFYEITWARTAVFSKHWREKTTLICNFTLICDISQFPCQDDAVHKVTYLNFAIVFPWNRQELCISYRRGLCTHKLKANRIFPDRVLLNTKENENIYITICR